MLYSVSYQLYGLKNPTHAYLKYSHSIISPSKMTDDQNSQKMLVGCTHIVVNLVLTRRIYSHRLVCLQLFACKITQSYEKITTGVTYCLPNGL